MLSSLVLAALAPAAPVPREPPPPVEVTAKSYFHPPRLVVVNGQQMVVPVDDGRFIEVTLKNTSTEPLSFKSRHELGDLVYVKVTDDRLKLLSFTGSPSVGWHLKARAGKKKVVLELGGNAAVVVDRGWDLKDAVERIVFGAFYQSGQSCISVQRIYAHTDIYGELRDRIVERTRTLVMGDPRDEETFIGPMISEGDAKRLKGWIHDAVT